MANILPGIISLLFAVILVIDACIIFASYVYSRFIFSNYLKKYHRQKWEELVYKDYHSLRWNFFDKTPQLQKFRTESTEDLGDPNIQKMRQISVYLFKTGIAIWLGLIAIFIVVSVLSLLIREK